jgi:molybdenum cofactor biosynthesis enzyme MoaA
VTSAAESTAEGDDDSRSGFLPDRILHLHPTRLCNLACRHCYSESDPQQQTALDPVMLCDALQVLRAEGYSLISVSGGEPLVYQPLRTVIESARRLGFRTTMISNGLLATTRMDPITSQLDGVAISFDGLAATHNALRGRPDAFGRACTALQRLAAKGRSVSAAISLTRDAICELPELADHLVSLGARALQIRPVARAGRARSLADTSFYNATDHARLYLVVLALRQELPAAVHVHCDLAPAQGLWQQRDAYAGLLGSCEAVRHEDRPLADLVNPLVITETGLLKPIAYDFDGHFDVASIDGLSSDRLRAYKRQQLPRLQALVGGALAGLQDLHVLVDWFDHCTRLSEKVRPSGGDHHRHLPIAYRAGTSPGLPSG